MPRGLTTCAVVVAAAGALACTPGNPCRLRASLTRGPDGSTVTYSDADGGVLASCSVPAEPLGPCDSGVVTCRDPAGSPVSFCEFDSCFLQP